MCTVTLRCGREGLLLTMNRDERVDRAPEEMPRRIPGDGDRPSWIAPFDGATGGTWIGVNDRGVAACLLNGYAEGDAALRGRPGVPSRGSIVPRFLEDQDGAGPARVRATLDFSAYPSFTLLVVSAAGGEVVRWRHGGGIERETIDPGWTLLTSSSWNEPEVAAFRRRAFDLWRETGEETRGGLPRFQIETAPGDERSSPFMTRTESATRSVTQVRVGAHDARLRWWPRHGLDPIDPEAPRADISLALSALAYARAPHRSA